MNELAQEWIAQRQKKTEGRQNPPTKQEDTVKMFHLKTAGLQQLDKNSEARLN